MTSRGFTLYTFTDSNDIECQVQQSSSAEESKVWIGSKDIGLQHFKSGKGWQKVELVDTIEECYIANNRMHLNLDQARELRYILDLFIENGEL